MRMDDSPISVETPTVAPEATTPGTAAVASSLFVSKKAEDSDTTGDPSSVAEVTPPPLPEEKLQGKELIEALKKQVEFYFSKQNLQTDGFLVSHMNAQMCVPVSVIAQFHKIQQLTSDTNLICESVKDSTVCSVTPDGIKPTIKQERNTIILREIPSETSQEKIREIFTGDGVAPIKSIRSDVGDTWFVTMDSEDDALSTILALRSKTFEGKPVKARLKSENILRSFFPVPTAAEVQPTAAAAASAPYTLGGPGAAIAQMPYGMPTMGSPMMNGQPSFVFPGPGARGMYGRGMMMQGPAGGMRFGGMQHAGMVQGGQGGGRGGGMMQGRGSMQMGGMGGMGGGGGGPQGHGMGQQMMGINPKQQLPQQQQQQHHHHHNNHHHHHHHQHHHNQHHQQSMQSDGRGEKGSSRERDGMQQGGGYGGVYGSGGGGGHQSSGGYAGQHRRSEGGGRGGGGERHRKGDRGSNGGQGRAGDGSGHGPGGRSGGGKSRNSGGRDMLSAANFPPLPGADVAVSSAAGATPQVSTGSSAASADAEQSVPPMGIESAGNGTTTGGGGAVKSAAGGVAVVPAVLPSTGSVVGGIGYPGTFTRYTQDEILKIVSSMSQADVAVVPGVEDIRWHSLVFDAEANIGLLMRQRSVSIDECREQLRKGRPVHQEGVIAGAVDYGSYMYGEGHEQGPSGWGHHPRGSAGNGDGHSRGGGGGGGGAGGGDGHSRGGGVGGGGAGGGGAGAGEKKKGDHRNRKDRGDRTGAGEQKSGGSEGRAPHEDKPSRHSRGGGGKNSSGTGTTGPSSSSLSSSPHVTPAPPEPMGAYAAALLKKPRPVPSPNSQPAVSKPAPPSSSSSKTSSGKGPSRERKVDVSVKAKDASVGSSSPPTSSAISGVPSSGGGSSGARSSSLPSGHDSAGSSEVASATTGGREGVRGKEAVAVKGAGDGSGDEGGSAAAGTGLTGSKTAVVAVAAARQAPVPQSRPSRRWEKTELAQQKSRGWGDAGRGGASAVAGTGVGTGGGREGDANAKSAPGTSSSGTGTPGTGDKKPPSTTASVSVSGDEASDSGCAGAGEGSEGSADVKCPTKELVGGKEQSTSSDSSTAETTVSTGAASTEEAIATKTGWGGKKSFLDVVKTPGNHHPPSLKTASQPSNKEVDNNPKFPMRGRPEPAPGGDSRGGGGRKEGKSPTKVGSRNDHHRDHHYHHHHNKGGSGGHHKDSGRLPNGRAGSGLREKGAWA